MRELDPASPALVTDGHGQWAEFLVVDVVIAVLDDRLVNVIRRDQCERYRRALEMGLETARFQQAEGQVQILAEESVPVAEHLPRVDDYPQPQQTRLTGRGDAAVVDREQAGERRDQLA